MIHDVKQPRPTCHDEPVRKGIRAIRCHDQRVYPQTCNPYKGYGVACQARSRKDHAPENLAILRRLALNVARRHADAKTSMRPKLKRAGWDKNFLRERLANMRQP